MHYNCPKSLRVGAGGIYVFPIYVSTRLFDVTYLNTENHMIYIAFFNILWLKKKRKITYWPFQFQAKGQTNLYLF